MFHLSDSELAAIDRNHTRLQKIGDRHRTLDLFATRGAEDLTLLGERIQPATTTTETTTASPQLCFSL